MNVELIKLKIKIKHLALEPAIIRKEERKILELEKDFYKYFQLYQHRTGPLREEARATQLAYAFLKNRPYSGVEMPNSEVPYLVKMKMVRMINVYGYWHDSVQEACKLSNVRESKFASSPREKAIMKIVDEWIKADEADAKKAA